MPTDAAGAVGSASDCAIDFAAPAEKPAAVKPVVNVRREML